jgi:hypothetical protein
MSTTKRKGVVSMSTVLRGTDPKKIEREHQEAMEGMQRPTPPMFFLRGEEAAAEVRGSAPGPWAEAAPGAGIDAAALPSATGPKTEAQGEAAPVKTTGARGEKRARRSWLVVGACVAVALATPVVVVIVGGMRERGTTAGGAAHLATAAPSATAAPGATAALSATAAPSATTMPGVMPAATAISTATARPGATAGPSAPAKPRPRGAHDDPYRDPAVPGAAVTTAPRPSTAPEVTAPPQPTAAPSTPPSPTTPEPTPPQTQIRF